MIQILKFVLFDMKKAEEKDKKAQEKDMRKNLLIQNTLENARISMMSLKQSQLVKSIAATGGQLTAQVTITSKATDKSIESEDKTNSSKQNSSKPNKDRRLTVIPEDDNERFEKTMIEAPVSKETNKVTDDDA